MRIMLKMDFHYVESVGTTYNCVRLEDGKPIGLMDHISVVLKHNAVIDVDPEVR